MERHGGLEPGLRKAWIDGENSPCGMWRTCSRLLSKPGFKPRSLLHISSQSATFGHAMGLDISARAIIIFLSGDSRAHWLMCLEYES